MIAGLLFIPTTIFDMIWGVRYLQEARGLDYASAVMRSATVPLGWIIGCPLLGFVSDRIGRRKPVIVAGAVVLLALPRVDPVRTRRTLFPPYVLGLVAGIASGAAMLPYTVIKEANPPEVSGTATGVVNFLNFTFSALLGPGVRLDAGARQRRRRAMTLEHYQTAFQPLLYGVALAIVLTFLLKETGPAVAASRARRPREAHVMTQTPGTGKYEQLLARCRSLEPVPTAVAHPCEETALAGAIEAGAKGLIAPILVGPEAKIREIAKAHGIDLGQTADRRRAAQPCRGGEGGGARAPGRGRAADEGQPAHRRAARRRRREGDGSAHRPAHQPRVHHGRADLSQGPHRHRRARSTSRRRSRTRSTSARTRSISPISLGVARPKVAILAAVETVNSKMPATIDAAALCKMADRGQITGGILDGPLAFDNAISKDAARIKGIVSEVAGDPDILLVPDLEAGNMLAKQLTFLANADSAGLVLGARVPIILTSRADSVRSRIASCAVAVLAAHARRRTSARMADDGLSSWCSTPVRRA